MCIRRHQYKCTYPDLLHHWCIVRLKYWKQWRKYGKDYEMKLSKYRINKEKNYVCDRPRGCSKQKPSANHQHQCHTRLRETRSALLKSLKEKTIIATECECNTRDERVSCQLLCRTRHATQKSLSHERNKGQYNVSSKKSRKQIRK